MCIPQFKIKTVTDTKNRFYEELENVFNLFHMQNMKIVLGEFSAEVGRKDIFKMTNRNKSLPEISNVMGIE
jgi:hypothetical protein